VILNHSADPKAFRNVGSDPDDAHVPSFLEFDDQAINASRLLATSDATNYPFRRFFTTDDKIRAGDLETIRLECTDEMPDPLATPTRLTQKKRRSELNLSYVSS
jgi:hypothetical protein